MYDSYEPLKDEEDEDVIWMFCQFSKEQVLVSMRTYSFADLITIDADALSATEAQNNSKYGCNQANLKCDSW